jgi:D-alanyl-D-alanine carboxypeptidase
VLEAALKQGLNEAREDVGAPGAVLAVSTPSCGLWVGASGQSRPDDPMRPDHVVRIGSITKTYMAAALTDLAIEGKLSLDDAMSPAGPWRCTAGTPSRRLPSRRC